MSYGVHTLVDEHQAQVVASRILLVNLSKGGGKVETAQKQPDGNSFSCNFISLRSGEGFNVHTPRR
jgi:hypothetical protein